MMQTPFAPPSAALSEPPEVQLPKPWNAAVFSLILPGMGHAWSGQLGRGALLVLAQPLFTVPGAVLLATRGQEVLGALLFYAGFLLSYVAVAADAWHLEARREVARPGRFSVVWRYLVLLALGTLAQWAGRHTLAEPYRAPSGSMAPAILAGSHVIATPLPYGLMGGTPQVGDVIAFSYPPDPSLRYIMRVVALGGQTVEVRGGQIIVDGAPWPLTPGELEDFISPSCEAVAVRAMSEEQPGREPRTIFALDDGRGFGDFGPLAVPEHAGAGSLRRLAPALAGAVSVAGRGEGRG